MLWILVAALVIWNGLLTYNYKQLEQQSQHSSITQTESGTTIVHNTLNGYTTDITDVAAKDQSCVVCVSKESDETNSKATGIIYAVKEDETYIVTSAAFVENVNYVNVTFANGVMVKAGVVGKDDLTDICLLKASPGFTCTPLKMVDTRLVKQGEYIVAIGAKQKITQSGSVCFGVVSKPSQLLTKNEEESWIVSAFTGDVCLCKDAIGGPIVNLSGQCIGMLSGSLTSLNATQGITSAISANEISLVVKQLAENKEVTRGYLGVTVSEVKELAVYEKSALDLDLTTNTGLLVSHVYEDSPAYSAGFVDGDVLSEFEGKTLRNICELNELLYAKAPGDEVVIKVLRDGRVVPVTVVLA